MANTDITGFVNVILSQVKVPTVQQLVATVGIKAYEE